MNLEELQETLHQMICTHIEMSKVYYMTPSLERDKDEYLKNCNKQVRFRIKSDTLDNIVSIKQSCYFDERNRKIYFKTRYYLDDKLVKKNINFLHELLEDICLDPDVSVEYPVIDRIPEPELPKKPENEQLSLFDLM